MWSRWFPAERLGLLVMLAAVGGCQKSPPLPRYPSPYPELGITVDNYPKLDGSTSTEPLQAIVACKMLGAEYEWVHSEGRDTRSLWASGFETYLKDHKRDPGKQRLVTHINESITTRGTHEAYVNLLKKYADLILVARGPSDEESERARKSGIRLDARPVALDAFVFLLSSANPVESLTVAQIRDIYSGRVTNWRDVGGRDMVVHPYQRTRNSGSQELMRTLVMKDRAMIKAPDLLTGALMSSPFLAIDEDASGIGYSVYYYHEFMAPRASIKLCAVENVLPSAESLRSGRYPFVTEVYVVIRGDLPPEHPAHRLRDWLLGPAGQKIVEESGYVPIREGPTATNAGDSRE